MFSKIEIIEKMLYGGPYYISSCNKLFNRDLFENIENPLEKHYEDIGTLFIKYMINQIKLYVAKRLYITI